MASSSAGVNDTDRIFRRKPRKGGATTPRRGCDPSCPAAEVLVAGIARRLPPKREVIAALRQDCNPASRKA